MRRESGDIAARAHLSTGTVKAPATTGAGGAATRFVFRLHDAHAATSRELERITAALALAYFAAEKYGLNASCNSGERALKSIRWVMMAARSEYVHST